ncbi:MAG TPA: hypothetical protein DCP57_10360 [Gammaproteobacteria bacterium]|nr:hypothetical protein [Gammaproteobacteria bacterium]|tara:strand:- start:724 stop:1614 length:891 start_codon:yes stop_codon:yes gene_type:complete
MSTSETNRRLRIAGKKGARVGTPVFLPSKEVAEYFDNKGYKLLASPRLFPGQKLIVASQGSDATLYLAYYGEGDEVGYHHFEHDASNPGNWSVTVPELAGPIFEIGFLFEKDATIDVDFIKWEGAPNVVFERAQHKGSMWRRAWVNAVDHLPPWYPNEMFRLVQNEGLGMLSQGTKEWMDYEVSGDVQPHLVTRAGIAARVQGLSRFYALFVTQDQKLQLVKKVHQETVLAEAPFAWELGEQINLTLRVAGNEITGSVNGAERVSAQDDALSAGAIGLLVDAGRTSTSRVEVKALS